MKTTRRDFLRRSLAFLAAPLILKAETILKYPKPKEIKLYISPEALADIRSWDLREIDGNTRRNLFYAHYNS